MSAFPQFGGGPDGWQYRKPVTLGDGTLNAATQIPFRLDTASLIAAGKMRSDCGDLRIYDANTAVSRPYWIESGCNTATTTVWTWAGTGSAYVYYGDPTATSASSTSMFAQNLIRFDVGSCSTTLCQFTDSHAEMDQLRLSRTRDLCQTQLTSIDVGYACTPTSFNTNTHDLFYQYARFLFIPDMTGTWTFTIIGDDAGEVGLAPTDAMIDTSVTVIASGYGSCGICSGHSGTVSLTAGNPVWMYAMMSDATGFEGLRVSATRPLGTSTTLSTTSFPNALLRRTLTSDQIGGTPGAEQSLPGAPPSYVFYPHSDVAGTHAIADWGTPTAGTSGITEYDFYETSTYPPTGSPFAVLPNSYREYSHDPPSDNATVYGTIVAKTSLGSGDDSSMIMRRGIPYPVGNFAATKGDTTITFSWTLAPDGNSWIDYIRITCGPTAATATQTVIANVGSGFDYIPATQTSWTAPAGTFTNGQTYYCAALPHNAYGDAAVLSAVASATPSGLPLGPYYFVDMLPINHTVSLDWSAADGNGAPVTGYWIAMGSTCASLSPVQHLGASVLATTVALTNGTQDCFAVRAENMNGQGALSDGQLSYAAGIPDPPKNPTITSVGMNTISLAWSAGHSGGATATQLPLDHYDIVNDTRTLATVDGASTSVTMSFLPNGVTQNLRVIPYGIYENGAPGRESPTVTATPVCSGGPANDCFYQATAITASPYSTTATTTGATTEYAEPAICVSGGPTISKTVWYKWTLQGPGTATVSTVSGSTNFDTILGAYHFDPNAGGGLGSSGGGGSSAFVPIGCNDDFSGTQSQLSFSCTTGDVVYIQVGGKNAASGNAGLSVSGCGPPLPPVTTATLSGTAGTSPWYRSAVQVTLACAPGSAGTSCTGTFYQLNGGATTTYAGAFSVSAQGANTLEYWSTNSEGQTETHHIVTIGVDTVAPTIAAPTSNVAAHGSWYDADVTFTWACSDAAPGSGPVSASVSATPVTTEGTGFSRTGTCTDLAGNTASNTKSGINLDKTPPTVGAASYNSAPNANGWWRTDVTATWTCTDQAGLSGATSPSVSALSSGEGNPVTISSSCTDLAGNSAPATTTAKIDKTNPTIGAATVTPAANANGWRNVDATATWPCSDALSGAASPTVSATSSGEGSSLSILGTCTDVAGNTLSAFVSVKVDKTPPTIGSAVLSPAANANGWRNVDVTATWGCNDPLSGVPAPGSTSATTSGEGSALSLSGTCTDLAGNTNSSSTSGIKVDKTAPSACTGAASGTAGSNGWFRSAITETLTATDGLSGVSTIADSIDGGSSTAYSAPFSVSGESSGHTISCVITDMAGNSATLAASNSPVKIDSIPPSACTGSFASTLGTNGWYTAPGTETLAGTDATSGVASISYSLDGATSNTYGGAISISTDSAGHSLTCTLTDAAGNQATLSASNAPIKIDQTPPNVCTGSFSGPAGSGGWYKGPGSQTLTAGDALSGVASLSYSLDAGSWTAYSAPFSVSADGSHTVNCLITDNAGNVGTVLASNSPIRIDSSAPSSCTGSFNGNAGTNGWYTGSGFETLTAGDGGSGVASLKYTLDTGSLTTYASPFSISTDSTGHTITCTITDTAGNQATLVATNSPVKIDSTPPSACTGTYSGTLGTNGWYKQTGLETLAGVDATSGVAAILYRLDGASGGVTYTAPFSLGGDSTGHTVSCTVTDNAGNQATLSATNSPVKIDITTPSTCTGSFNGPPASNGWYRSGGSETLTASDATSGVASIAYVLDNGGQTSYASAFSVSGDSVGHVVQCRVTDNAGNLGVLAASNSPIKIDGAPPTACTGTYSGTLGTNGWYKQTGAETLVGVDATSGAASISYQLDGGTPTAYSAPFNILGDSAGHTITCTVTDNAGNSNAVAFAASNSPVKIDITPPSQCNGVASGTSGNNGWWRSPVTEQLSGVDATSGVASLTYALDGGTQTAYSAAFTIAGDSTAHTVSCVVTDSAGNQATLTAVGTPVKIDATPPSSCAGSLAGATLGSNGWYKTGGSETLSASDATSGVASLSYALDAAPSTTYSSAFSVSGDSTGHTITCTIVDNAGNSATLAASNAPIKIDGTAPTACTGAYSGTLGNAPWYRTTGAETLAGVDATSGAASLTYSLDGATQTAYVSAFTINGDSASGHTITCIVTDAAGNSNSVAFAASNSPIKIDSTPPSACTGTFSGATLGTNGWWRGSGSETLTGVDATSGVASLTRSLDGTAQTAYGGAFAVSGDSTGHTVTCVVTDNAGNSNVAPIAATNSPIKIDGTAPTACTGAYGGTLGANGWYTIAGSETLTGADATSGVASLTRSLDGATQTAYASPFSIAGDSTGHTVSCVVTDNAGNQATIVASNSPIKIDSTPPSACTGTFDGHAGSNGWYTSNGLETLAGVDATSGAASVKYVLDGAAQATYGAPFSVSGDSTAGHTISCTVTDNAGNSATLAATNSPIKIDSSAPGTCTGSYSGTLGTNGWYTRTGSETLTVTDSGSGIASIARVLDGGSQTAYAAPFSITGDSGGHTISCVVTDNAGNQVTLTASNSPVKIDITAPSATLASRTPAANANGWNNADVTVTWSCADATSGPAATSVSTTVTTQASSQTATASCADLAGNTQTASQTGISIDKTAPTGVGSRSPAANAQGWNNVDVTASATCSDALSGIPAQPAASVISADGAAQSRTFTCVDAAGNSATVTVTGVSIDKTLPTITGTRSPAANGYGWNNADVTVSWTCSDALSGVLTAPTAVVVSTEGASQSRAGTCTDKAGNAASATVGSISIDKTAPALAPASDITAEATGPSGASVPFTAPGASDGLSGALGVACAPASASTFALGDTTVGCSVSDRAGNSATSSFHVHVVDTTPPRIDASGAITAEATSSAGAIVAYASPATHDLVDGDAAATCSPASGTTFALGATTVTCRASDAHGNAATPTTFTVTVVDTTPPAISPHADVRVDATDTTGTIVTFALPTATDAVDGSDAVTCAPASGASFAPGDSTVQCTATDAAGNTARSSFVVHVVPVAPAAPIQLVATASSGKVRLDWARGLDGGSSIKNYEISFDGGSGTLAHIDEIGTNTSYTVMHLVDGTTYRFAVAQKNAIGTGPLSAPVIGRPTGPPGAPTILSATQASTTTTIHVTWAAPSTDGGLAIAQYRLYAHGPNEAPWLVATLPASARGYDDTMETAGTRAYSVTAENAAGEGPASAEVTGSKLPALGDPVPDTYRSCSSSPCGSVGSRQPVISIAAGGDHTCVLLADGRVDCWGANDSGASTDHLSGEPAIAIATGSDHTCALLATNNVDCWGSDTFAKSTSVLTKDVKAVAVGEQHTCFQRQNGSIDCQGGNGYHQADAHAASEGILQLAAGAWDTCFVLADHSVGCQGLNDMHELDGDGGQNDTAVAVGYKHACALRADGSVACWGSSIPQPPLEVQHRAIAVASGRSFSCALLDAGTVTCWGSATNGKTAGYQGATRATAIALGDDHGCALLTDGTVTCWGSSASGQADAYPGAPAQPSTPGSSSASLVVDPMARTDVTHRGDPAPLIATHASSGRKEA